MSKQQNWAWFIPPQVGIVAYAEGSPGEGKSACVAALARAAQRRFLPLYLESMLPEDLGGVPAPRTVNVGDRDRDCVVRLLDESFLRAKEELSVVLLDELNQASHSMMAAAQEWINPPPPNAWVFAAGNPIGQASNGVEFTPPFVNRLCVVEWECPEDAIEQGWANGFRDYPSPNIPIVPADYLENFGPYWGSLLVSFRRAHPELFRAYPKNDAEASKPWPSPRSWTNVGKLCAACDAVGGLSDVRAALIRGCVGEAAAAQFLTWLTQQNIPDPEALLAAPHTLKLSPRFDINRATLAAVLGRIRAEATPTRWEAGYDVLEVAFGQQPEVAMSAEGALFAIKPKDHTPKIRNGAASEMRKLRLATAQ